MRKFRPFVRVLAGALLLFMVFAGPVGHAIAHDYSLLQTVGLLVALVSVSAAIFAVMWFFIECFISAEPRD